MAADPTKKVNVQLQPKLKVVLKPQAPVKPQVGPMNPAQIAQAPKATAHHPDMNFDGGLDTYQLPSKTA